MSFPFLGLRFWLGGHLNEWTLYGISCKSIFFVGLSVNAGAAARAASDPSTTIEITA